MSKTNEPTILVSTGGGGVGKTTASAALAVALARRGFPTLVASVDPARRLADAMGVTIGPDALPVLGFGADGLLDALMPEPRQSANALVDYLFEGHPEAKARLLENRVYGVVADALVGVHDLVATMLVAEASASGRYAFVVVDTAPSRNALEFLTYPERVAGVLDSRAMGWLANLAKPKEGGPSRSGGILGWGISRAEKALERVLGPGMLGEIGAMFGELFVVRARFSALAHRAADTLLGPRAHFTIVAAPTGAACADAAYLARRLEKLKKKPRVVLLNRADLSAHASLEGPLPEGLPRALVEALGHLATEHRARSLAAERARRELAKTLPLVPAIELPFLEEEDPRALVDALARALDRELFAIAKVAATAA